jgi:hypothetical protein
VSVLDAEKILDDDFALDDFVRSGCGESFGDVLGTVGGLRTGGDGDGRGEDALGEGEKGEVESGAVHRVTNGDTGTVVAVDLMVGARANFGRGGSCGAGSGRRDEKAVLVVVLRKREKENR